MPVKTFRKQAIGKVILNSLLIILLILSNSPPVKASDNVTEIRLLLKNLYVDPVSTEVLNASTIDEMLERLGDPHTKYFSPEQYQEFLGSIDMRFEGIGIYIQIVPEGIKVSSAIAGSPAEEVGLKAGDIITRADGQSLVGLSSEDAVGLLRGLEGTSVKIRVKQGAETRDLTVIRRAITTPTVTGEVLSGHIGYLDLNSFGSDTTEEFETVVDRLRAQNVDGWIVDLRDNGGGYLSSAFDLAGYFIGPEVVVQIKDRTGAFRKYKAVNHDFTLSQPVIFLTNENSASASELLVAAVKDHQKAILVGTNTYGKGSVQSMFPLTNGGVLKMTIDHFFSPLGHDIDKVGVSPDVTIQQADSLKAAELILAEGSEALVMGKTPAYWKAWGEVSGVSFPPQYYPGYSKLSELSEIPLDKQFTVRFSGTMNWQSVNNTSIELINSDTGERTLSTFDPLGPSEIRVIPTTPLSTDATYWLVIHPGISDVSGQVLKEGGLVIAHTVAQKLPSK